MRRRRLWAPPVAVAISLLLSLLVAAANLYNLAASTGEGRVRDLRIVRLVRHVADDVDVNLLSAAPAWVHTERDLTKPAAAALLFACAALLSFLLLLPLALLTARGVRRLTRGRPRGNVTAASLAVLSLPAVVLAAAVALSPRMTALLLIVAALVVFAAAARLPEPRLARVLSRAGLFAAGCLVLAIAIAPFSVQAKFPAQHRAEPGAPNILLISIDSLRADHLHCYGYPRHTSPNLDALAQEGARFETVISPTSWTLPAHMTLLTSLPPEKHGVITNHLRLASGIETIPQHLHRSGYATAGFVSTTYLDGLYGFSRGFDVYDDYTILRVAGAKSRKAVTSAMVADHAIRWVEQHSASSPQQPFFLFLHFFDVHYDYNPPLPFARMFDGTYRGPATGDVDLVRSGMQQQDVDHVVALYDGEIAWVDWNIGRIVAALRARGLLDNTIVAVTADHGEEFLDHGQSGHFKTLYDEVLRVPLIIRYPKKVAAGRRVEGQVRLMDVAPTLFSLAGVRLPHSRIPTEARALACLLKPDALARPTPLLPAFGDLKGEIASLRTADAKLIVDLRTHREELYDLARDPYERHNIDAENEPKAEELRALLDRWRAATPASSTGEIELDDEEKESLKSLGYIR
ncbi:MAG: putative Arylsulfatase [Acidobacteria bacterium]|nr:putative Arylsulfatase [Acidobacteriota bacterium]